MAIHKWEIESLVDEIKLRKSKGLKTRVLSLGHPTLSILEKDLAQILGPDIFSQLEVMPDSEATIKRHGYSGKLKKIFQSHSLFKALDVMFDVLDFKAWEGYEKIADLNKALPEELKASCDILIDPGTLEHCFNAPQALKNIAELVSVGGLVIHNNPLTMLNHGFYNFSPEFFAGFYEHNGFRVETLEAISGERLSPMREKIRKNGRVYPDQYLKSFVKTPPRIWTRLKQALRPQKEEPTLNALHRVALSMQIFTVVRKQRSVPELSYPTQKKYSK